MIARPGLRARVSARVGALSLEVDLDTGPGTLALVGPNGAGKTSLLSIILGVMRAERALIEVNGIVLVDSEQRVDVPVEERRLGYVPQDYALFPHMTVRENVAFAVKSASPRPSAQQAAGEVQAALEAMGVVTLAERRPPTLSGGEKQRVALARALSVKPRALLLDEPLAALDVHARRQVRTFLAETLRTLALPTIVVTHDPLDASVLGERTVVLESGRVTQVGSWPECVARPASRFVEELVASSHE